MAKITRAVRGLGVARTGSQTHLLIYRATRGKVFGHLGRAPVLLLTTTGRRSGEPRTTPVIYVREGDGWVVIGSYGASDTPPAWALNLLDDPAAEVEVGGGRHAVRARVAEGAERDRLWRRMDDQYDGGFDDYAEHTDRTMHVFVLEPAR